MTTILSLCRDDPDGIVRTADEASRVFASGGVVLYPTDTVYGIGARATDAGLVDRVRAVKGKDIHSPLIMLASDLTMVERYAHVPSLMRDMRAALPTAPLTFILDALDALPWVTASDGSVSFRIPGDLWCRSVIQQLGVPITSTSANVHGCVQEVTVDGMLRQFGVASTQIDLAVDGGPLRTPMPSTIIDVRGDRAVIVRDGSMPRDLLAMFL